MLITSQAAYSYTGAPGLTFFSEVVYTNFFFITLTGLSYFAGAIAEEKEEGTLGLLRMTNLGPLTILLGKSSSRLLGIALLLLVQLPFTLLAVTLGGVSIHQVFAAYVSLGAYIFFVCNLALLFSVMVARVSLASMITSMALLLFFFIPVLCRALLDLLISRYHVLGPADPVATAFVWVFETWSRASAFGQLGTILTNGFAGRLVGFQVLSNLALGALFFLLAWWGFDRFTRDRRPGALARKLPAWRASRLGMSGAPRAWGQAVVWKDFFLFHGGWNGAILKSVAFLGFVVLIHFSVKWGNQASSGADYALHVGAAMGMVFLLVFGVEMAIGASRIFNAEIQGKTLAGLVGIPEPVSRMAYQKVGALLLSGAPSLAFALFGGLLVLASGHSNLTDDVLANKDFWLGVLIIGTQSLLFLHLTAYLSLSLKRLSLAVALGTMVVGNMLFTAVGSIFFRFGPGESTLVLYHCGLLSLTAFLHLRIGAKLAQVAAAEG